MHSLFYQITQPEDRESDYVDETIRSILYKILLMAQSDKKLTKSITKAFHKEKFDQKLLLEYFCDLYDKENKLLIEGVSEAQKERLLQHLLLENQ